MLGKKIYEGRGEAKGSQKSIFWPPIQPLSSPPIPLPNLELEILYLGRSAELSPIQNQIYCFWPHLSLTEMVYIFLGGEKKEEEDYMKKEKWLIACFSTH